MKFDTPIGTNRFQRQEVHRKYSEQFPKKFVETKEKEYTNGREKWNDAVKTIIGYGEEILGTKGKLNNNHARTYDGDIIKLSNEQKKPRLKIPSSNWESQIQALKHQRNVLLKGLQKRVNVNREKEIDEGVKGMERLQEESRMFKAANMLHRKRFKNILVYKKMENMS